MVRKRVNISISRTFHDYLLDEDQVALNDCFNTHKTKWHLGGVTFYDVGVWFREWIDCTHRQFLSEQECRRHLVINQEE